MDDKILYKIVVRKDTKQVLEFPVHNETKKSIVYYPNTRSSTSKKILNKDQLDKVYIDDVAHSIFLNAAIVFTLDASKIESYKLACDNEYRIKLEEFKEQFDGVLLSLFNVEWKVDKINKKDKE